jgi:hypothetical protein
MDLLVTLLIAILKLSLFSQTDATTNNNLRNKRAIGGDSLDQSNFVLYVDENTGLKYFEVPYVYMQQWLNDQRMWRTVMTKDASRFLSILSTSMIFFF